MSHILLAYATGEGQTAKVARTIADDLVDRGHDLTTVQIHDPPEPVDIEDYDAVVVGASIHVGKHQEYLLDFVRDHRDALAARPGAFFQVSLSAASTDPERRADAESYIRNFREMTGWNPTVVGNFAGALRYSEYSFLKRLMMKRIARKATGDTDTGRDYEYTDWDDVEAFATAVEDLVAEATVRAVPMADDGPATI